MLLDSPLSAMSTWMTYIVQVAFAHLVIWGVSSFVRSPRLRLRMWGGFLFTAVAYWILLCVPAGTGAPMKAAGVGAASSLPMGWSWAVPESLTARMGALPAWTAAIYIVIFAVLLLQMALKAWGLNSFLRTGQRPSRELNRTFQELCDEMEVSGCVLSLLPGLRSPATAGWWRPHVLLPAELVPDLDAEQLANILRHELVHIRRRDYLWDRLAALGCRIVFFHPVVWLAHRRLRWERELACDEAVVRHCDERRLQYAECLTTLARWWFLAEKNSRGAIGFASSASLLGTRVRALLHEPVRCSVFQRASRASVILLVLAMTAVSLPGMRLTLYRSLPEMSARTEVQSPRPRVTRAKSLVRQRATISQFDSRSAAEVVGTSQPSVGALGSTPATLSLIGKPAMPVFSGEQDNAAPSTDLSASAAPTASSSGGWSGSGGGVPQTATVKGPSVRDAVIGAIGAGVALGRSRTGSSSGGGGGTSGGSSGGSSGGEAGDHFLTPNPVLPH